MRTTRVGWFRRGAAILAAAVVSLSGANAGAADIVRIEEDWEVVIGTPDASDTAPQIVNVLPALGGLNNVHAVFELNHSSLPDFVGGGMQLQTWMDESLLDHRNNPKTEKLQTTGETVTYTLKSTVSDGAIEFEVVNGNSTTWGAFGGQGYLKTSYPTTATSFANYSPTNSTANSRIGYAKHRVQSFTLKEVRYYSDDGLEQTDTTDRVVHQLDN